MNIRFQVLIVVFMLGTLISHVNAQDLNSDPEASDLKARVVSVTYELKDASYSYSGNDSNLQLTIALEVWNPYNEEVTSYGSSSCRWGTYTVSHFNGFPNVENYGSICTSDWAPRIFPSGKSNEVSLNEVIFVNEDINEIPDGFILINGQGGTYKNVTDNFYGANITISSGGMSIELEDNPDEWGQILFTKAFLLDANIFPFMPIAALLGVIGRKFQN